MAGAPHGADMANEPRHRPAGDMTGAPIAATPTDAADYAILVHGLQTTLQAAQQNLQFLSYEATSLTARHRDLLEHAQAWLDDAQHHILRATHRKYGLKPRPLPTSQLLRALRTTTIQSAQWAAIRHGRRLTVDWPSLADMDRAASHILADPAALQLVLQELVNNTASNTPARKPKHIRVDTRAGARTLELRYADDGPGIPSNERPHIFTDGYRGHDACATRPAGAGAGLADARLIMQQMSGSIELADSQTGAAFTITIPAQNRPAP